MEVEPGEQLYLVEIETGKVLKRWRCGHMSIAEISKLAAKIHREYAIHDDERGLDLRSTAVDKMMGRLLA